MHRDWKVIVSVILASVFAVGTRGEECEVGPEIACYFSSWAIYRDSDGAFTTDDIDPKLCTTVIYSFAGLNLDLQIASLDQNADIALGGYYNLSQMKEANPCLRTSIALGGWAEGSLKYSVAASTEEWREKLAGNVLKFVIYYGFDGLDLDWEYPGARGGAAVDKANFVALLGAIKERFKPWGLRLSIAVGIDEEYYDIEGIAPIVDYVHFMGYDVTNSLSNVTGLLAPLSVVKDKLQIWLDRGLPKSKLILGMPTYGRCFDLIDSDDHDIGAPVAETKCGGVYTDTDGYMAFYEIQEEVQNNHCQGTEIVDDNVYSWCDDVWVTYDNPETVASKSKYVKEAGLGGAMIWAMDTDDFRGLFGDKFTLLRVIRDTLYDAN